MRIKRPDKKNAQSMLDAAEREMAYTLTINLSDASSSTIVRNIYECFRMLGDALMVARGKSSIDHMDAIRELLTLQVITTRPINLIDNLRRLRHNINYYGYRPSIPEVEDAILISHACFKPLADAIRKELST